MNQLRKLVIRSKASVKTQLVSRCQPQMISLRLLRPTSTAFLQVSTFNFSSNKMKPYFKKQKDVDEDEDIEFDQASESDFDLDREIALEEARKIAALNPQQVEQDTRHIIKVPELHTNSYKIGQLFGVDSYEILKKIEKLSKESIIDEFQDLSRSIIESLAVEYEKEIEIVENLEEKEQFQVRSPVVTIMGHVDHGKTTLLDAFRHSQKVKEEYGDITQSIGAFTFITDSQHEITFIDTPGHEAFQNLRVRGAKVTDLIILVISAIESIQPQTIEVIELALSLKIPVIVAINKIDREAADPDSVILDLSQHGMIGEELGGDVICVPISAKMKINLDILEQKIVEVAQNRLNLLEDFHSRAQCFVIESNFDEKSTQITATVLVKKGHLKQDDVFVCGPHEGKVRFMKNDQGKNIKIAYPGQAVHLAGFKHFPEVGQPLYACKSHDEAQFMANRIYQRREKELNQLKLEDQLQHESMDMKKKLKGLTRMEKRKMYGGDKSIMYEKIGLVEESDIEKYRKKLGLKKGVDLLTKDLSDVEEMVEQASISQSLDAEGKKKKIKVRSQRNKDFEKEEFKKILSNYKEEQSKREAMTPEEQHKYDQERMKLKEVYRGEDVQHFPIIIKASQAGVLETLLKEAEKVLGTNNYRISVIDYSVGPITEGDMNNAMQTGAVILGFDVPCSPMVSRTAESSGVVIKQHRIIYKFLEDIENFVYDANTKIMEETGRAVHVEVLGTASVSQIFKIKDPKSKANKMLHIAGCKVSGGDIERKHKYRVIRNGRCLQDNLKLSSMKKVQLDVNTVEKGHECGLCFENFDGELLPGDQIEAYRELEDNVVKFNFKPGVHQSY